jgi:hypothetical protein
VELVAEPLSQLIRPRGRPRVTSSCKNLLHRDELHMGEAADGRIPVYGWIGLAVEIN